MSDTNANEIRDRIRANLIGKTPEGKRLPLTLWDNEVELKQPDLGTVLAMADIDMSAADRLAWTVVQYTVVPGTDVRVFEDTDIKAIKKWPFAQDMMDLQDAITELTGIDISKAEAELIASPLDEPSSSILSN